MRLLLLHTFVLVWHLLLLFWLIKVIIFLGVPSLCPFVDLLLMLPWLSKFLSAGQTDKLWVWLICFGVGLNFTKLFSTAGSSNLGDRTTMSKLEVSNKDTIGNWWNFLKNLAVTQVTYSSLLHFQNLKIWWHFYIFTVDESVYCGKMC